MKKIFFQRIAILLIIGGLVTAGCTTPALYQRTKPKTLVIFERPVFKITLKDSAKVALKVDREQDIAKGSLVTYEDGYHPFSVGLKLAEMFLLFPLATPLYPFFLIPGLITQVWEMVFLPFLLLYPGKTMIPNRDVASNGIVLSQTWGQYFQESRRTLPWKDLEMEVQEKGSPWNKKIKTDGEGRGSFDLKGSKTLKDGCGIVMVRVPQKALEVYILFDHGKIHKVVEIKK